MLDTASPQAIAQATQPSDTSGPLLTLAGLAEFLTQAGFPISKRYLGQLCTPAIGEGPEAEFWFGSRRLYSPAKGLAWARARCRPHSPKEAA
jgi:hypothetical protein